MVFIVKYCVLGGVFGIKYCFGFMNELRKYDVINICLNFIREFYIYIGNSWVFLLEIVVYFFFIY